MDYKNLYYQPKDRYFAAEDYTFVVGDSPVVLDIAAKAAMGTPSIDGSILCRSTAAGDILVELSNDGTNYGDQFTLANTDIFSLFGHSVKKIRITHSGTDGGYRVVAR
jgi:hypothetical protein